MTEERRASDKLKEHEEAMQQEEQEEQEEIKQDDGTEPVFEGGPTQGQVDRWKEQFNNGVYMTEIEDEVFIWRPITRMEYKNILQNKQADSLFREERICETCVLWPENYDFTKMKQGKAGIPSLIADHIMAKSGFVSEGEATKL